MFATIKILVLVTTINNLFCIEYRITFYNQYFFLNYYYYLYYKALIMFKFILLTIKTNCKIEIIET